MSETTYRGRRAFAIENDDIRVTVLVEGGHIAELLLKSTGVNPLWTPPWPTIEPSRYSLAQNPEYGADAESKLLSGIHGHNLCLDLWGAPSPEEAHAGMTVHGEGSVVPYRITGSETAMTCECEMPVAQLSFKRSLTLDGSKVRIEEAVTNLNGLDRPVAWTQHVTLGPPFLRHGETVVEAPATKSMTYEGAHFDWPYLDGEDLRTYTSQKVSGRFSTHLLDLRLEQAYFTAYTPSLETELQYEWKRADFPWIGIWEENCSRTIAPWNGETVTLGMEFGVSPMPESRRKMIDRGSLFGIPGYRWIPARSTVSVRYEATLCRRPSV